jgi:hypothetical protein
MKKNTLSKYKSGGGDQLMEFVMAGVAAQKAVGIDKILQPVPPPSTKYQATIDYRGKIESFDVASPYGPEWAKTRAIAHFFVRHPRLNPASKDASPLNQARLAIRDGLKILLTPKGDA